MKKILSAIVLLFFAGILFAPAQFAESNPPEMHSKRPVLIIGDDINYPPYSYLDQNGQPTGFNVELAKYVGNAMGYDVEIRLDEWSKVRKALEDGSIDAVSGMFYSSERAKTYSFSSKHSVTSGDIFTQKNVAVGSVNDLKGKTVVVQKGDIVGEYLNGLNLGIHLVEVPTVNEALKLVSKGTYTYAGLLKLPGLYSISELKVHNLQAQGLNLTPNDYCMAVKKGNESLVLTLNGGLQIAKATGDYQKIYDKWLGVYEEKNLMTVAKRYAWILFVVIGVVAALAGWSVLLKGAVARKTLELLQANKTLQVQQEELTATNEEMEASMEELIAIEEELREQFDRLMESEQNLRSSEGLNHAILNAIPDIIFVMDQDGRFLNCMAGDGHDLLMPKQAFLGKTIREILPPEISDIELKCIREALATGKLQQFEYELDVDGERRIFEMRISKSHDDEVIGITRNITEQRMYQERIEYLSYHDQLTGLYNRRFFEEELRRLDIPRNLPLSILMADVNGLKLINDSFGHQAGDELLVKVASVFRKACRGDEIISRVGGDEFVILLPKMEKDQAEDLIRRIKEISEKETVASVNLSISFGWEAKRSEDQDIHEVFNRAEDYMYKKKLFEGPSMRGKTIGAIINTLHEKNPREEEHSQRVSDLSRRLAEVLCLSVREIEEIKTVGLLHDIGKIAIHEYLLNKPGKLTPEEFEEVQRHPEIGYRILSSVNDLAEMSEYVLAHHERWDGKGYPRGLTGEEIPLQARMIAIADAYDAMTSERSYRTPLTEDEAVAELLRNAGTQFDPDLLRLFVEGVLYDRVNRER